MKPHHASNNKSLQSTLNALHDTLRAMEKPDKVDVILKAWNQVTWAAMQKEGV